MGGAMSTCARLDGCDGRETVVDYVEHKRERRNYPSSPSHDGSESEEASDAEEPWAQDMAQHSIAMMQATGAAPDARPGMHPRGGLAPSASFVPVGPAQQLSWMPPPQMRGPRSSMAQVVPGPGWHIQPQQPPPRNLTTSRSTSPSVAGFHQAPSSVNSHTGSSVLNHSPLPTTMLHDDMPQPVPSQTHRLQSVPSLRGCRTPMGTSNLRSSPVPTQQGAPISEEPQPFQVIATVADFERGFDLFGAKIRDAALAAGHTSETMDNKYVSITDSYGRVFNWNRPLDFEPTMDMFPLCYRYTPPTYEEAQTPVGTRGSAKPLNSMSNNMRNVQEDGYGKDYDGRLRSMPEYGGSENYAGKTLPMVMRGF